MDEQIEQIRLAIKSAMMWWEPGSGNLDHFSDKAARAAHSVMAGIAVDEPMVDRAMKAFGETEIVGTNFTRRAIRAALVAALAPPRRHD